MGNWINGKLPAIWLCCGNVDDPVGKHVDECRRGAHLLGVGVVVVLAEQEYPREPRVCHIRLGRTHGS
ncbi:MAG: hypothetical protein ACLFNT_07090, partial [Spirochaetales bacterium]